MKVQSSLLIALSVVTSSHVEAAEPVQVFILAGQSNMVGYGDGSKLDESLRRQEAILYDHHNPDARVHDEWLASTSTQWEALQPKGPALRYGPELTFGRELAKAIPTSRIAILKMAQGGTNIHEHWARGLAPYTDEGPELLYKSQLYHALLGSLDSTLFSDGGIALAYPNEATRLDNALKRLTDAQDTYVLSGFIWMQGENEAGGKAAFKYRENLESFFHALREDLHSPTLPIVLGRVSDNLYARNGGPIPVDRDANLDAVRAAQQAVADADARIAWVDTDDLTAHEEDPYHFDSIGYQTLGMRFAQAYVNLIQTDPTDGGLDGATPTDAGTKLDASTISDASIDATASSDGPTTTPTPSTSSSGCSVVGNTNPSIGIAALVGALALIKFRRQVRPKKRV